MHAAEIDPRAPRAPVQARSQRTRAKLLAATADSLFELGFAGAKTNLIAERAGVSQGALYRHFPSKLDLLEATLAHVLAGARAQFRAGFEADPDAESDPAGAAFRHLWTVFASAPLQGAFEIYQAARTDRELAERAAPLIAEHRSRVVAGARTLFPQAARDHEDFDGAVHALLSTMQGAAIVGALAAPSDEFAETRRRSVERMLRNEFERTAALN